jgi:isochorismate hydrolase
LAKEKDIRDHLASLNRKQIIVGGGETDVCVLQSCLGLLRLGYEVYMVEDLLFSSSANVDSALVRMKVAGATFVTYKTLFYELVQAAEGGPYATDARAKYGQFPADLPDSTV